MRKLGRNTFNEGMLLDVHPSVQKSTTTRKMKNFRVITRDNNSFIVTNLKGFELKGALTSNYVPLAIKEKNGVAYILSAEAIDGVATGRGEVGCFPSPDYATGNITFSYRPFMNYAGDSNAFPSKNGPFRSLRFNLNLVDLPDLELQNDYDGSINMIFASANNPMRIINSGFAVKPGRKYELIDRTGTKDTNRYTINNFENVINLISRSTKLLKVELVGCVPGGKVPAGNVQLYFAYATSDGNETEIIAQSFTVPVFNGEKVGNISGPKQTGEATNKMVRFTLSNLDQSYAHITAFVVHADGMNTQVRTAYRINQKYTILGATMDFVYTGFEEKLTIPISDLIGETPAIDTAGTIAQVQGMLVAANIKEKRYDVDAIRKFCRMIKVGHKEIILDLIGPEDNMSRAFDEEINQSAMKAGTDGYNGGYVNPRNVHDKLGYWGGEAYPFAARVFFPDGSHSPLFPCVGIDNISNLNTATLESASDALISDLDTTGGFSTDGKMLNNMGIYRFPNRNASGVGQLFSRTGETEGRITANGVTFKIPALNVDLGGGKTIKDYAIGIQFFRGERRPDALVQGLMIDCHMVPSVRVDEANDPNRKLWDFQLNSGGYTEANSKLIPTYNHILEAIHIWDDDGNAGRTNSESDDDNVRGIVPFRFNVLNRDPHTKLSANKSPFAMISSDLIVNPQKFSGVSSKDIQARILYRFNHTARIKTARAGQSSPNGDHFSALIPTNSEVMPPTQNFTGLASWTPENSEIKNSIGFGSAAYFQTREGDKKSKFCLFRVKYNSYLGVRLNTTLRASSPLTSGEAGEKDFGLLNQEFSASFLANIYEGSSQRSADATRQVYQNIDGIRYFPISGKMYFDDSISDADTTNTLEGALDGNRKITLFNGDCFINYTLRKVFNNAEFDDPDFADKNSRVRLGYTIGVVNEGNENASFRSNETIDLIEGERKHPYNYITKQSSTGDAYGRNNQWRDYYQNESSGYNKGYGSVSGNILSATLPKDAPYLQSHWSTRIWVTAQHIPNSFENGYRRFFRTSYKDYPTKHGQIVKLISNNDQLYCIQETAVGLVPVNEKIQTGTSAGEPIYVESPTVLPPKMRMLSEEIGSTHKRAIFSTDNSVYGVSIDRSVIWHTQLNPDKLVLLSDLSIRSYLDDNYGSDASLPIKTFDHNIVTTWNKKFEEVLFTFYKKEGSNYDNDRSFTIAFNETTRKIHSFYSFVPFEYFNLGKDLYSFGVKANFSQFWLHDTLNPEIPMNTFYGIQEKSSVTFVSNEDIEFEKGYTNLEITSNRTKPSKAIYQVQGALAEHDLVYVPGNVLASNINYNKGKWELSIPKITSVHNQDVEQKVPDTTAGASSALAMRARVKGKYAVIELIYSTNDLIELQSVITHYKIMR